ncbi:MFS transporter, DHA1 family, inner membrane transport protein [Paracoccus thiocyanatus]|uniref:MFS transporter, DHA1 family, inner membrane transport protein n=1 Tax=Paracoccus thiocyanatus TaxID=34006 RepID=A0A1N6PRQ4_9RHOB|nr:MFS transporter [Paracoccus thiocyanatus]SIQ07055.1 MFS transporter, DHA1 family, inner membrane transport protein [Paracoccus thiocyanatus]
MTPQPNLKLAVLALGLGAFAIGTSEFAAMGLLPWYASDLGITEPQAGHVVSAYALGVVVGAPVTSILGARLPRRRYLAALIAGYGLMNLLAAVLPGYGTLVGARFLAGLPHGGFLGVAMLFAADALPREQRAKGVTQVLLGLTVANIAGVPLASILGQGLGWRWGFALPAVLALLAGWLILRLAPHVGPPKDARPLAELKALRNPAVVLILLVGAIGFGGLFAVYSYLSAAMLATAQPPAWAVPAALSAFGVGGTLGSIRAARLTIRHGPWGAALRLMLFMTVTQAFAALAVGNWGLMLVSSFLLGLGSGMVVPLQTRLMDVAGEAQSMAAAMNHAAFNAANALGPWLAGLALAAGWGWRSSGLVAVALSAAGMLALALAWWQARLAGDQFRDHPARR